MKVGLLTIDSNSFPAIDISSIENWKYVDRPQFIFEVDILSNLKWYSVYRLVFILTYRLLCHNNIEKLYIDPISNFCRHI